MSTLRDLIFWFDQVGRAAQRLAAVQPPTTTGGSIQDLTDQIERETLIRQRAE